MPENIDEMLVRVKPIVSDLFKKMNMIDEKIVELTATRNKISTADVTHPIVVSQIETLNNLISKLTALRNKIHNQLHELSKAMKKHKIIGGGLDDDITKLMSSIEEYFDELDKLDNQNMTDSELDTLNEKLNVLNEETNEVIGYIEARIAGMSGGKKRKTKKINKKSKKINKKSTKINKKSKKINKKSTKINKKSKKINKKSTKINKKSRKQ